MAMMPKAPGLFSITIGWPRIGRMCSPTMRMTTSVALPGPNGTMTLIGLLGNFSCAVTALAAIAVAATARQVAASRMKAVRFMSSSLRSCLRRDLAGFRAQAQGTALARTRNAIVASSTGMSGRIFDRAHGGLAEIHACPPPQHAIVSVPQAGCGSGRFCMIRRHFMALLGGAAVGSVGEARAQPAERMRRMGVLVGSAQDDPESPPRTNAFEKLA